MNTSDVMGRAAGALVGVLAGLALGGTGLAFAQESPSTEQPPAAESPATPTPGGRDGCDKDGDGVPDNRGQDAPATNQTDL